MRVGIDLDETVYPFVDVLAKYINMTTDRPVTEMPAATRWAFYEDWGYSLAEYLDLYRQGVDDGFIFAEGDPIPDAWDALTEIRERGHTVHLVTNRFVGRFAHANTEHWLNRWHVPYDTLTYARDKTAVRTNVFLDDKPSNVDELRAVGCRAYVYDRGRSDQANRPYLVSGWSDFLDKL